MKRQDKYPETKTFRFYNANPHNRITGDCVARAIATATDIPYNEVVQLMADYQIKTGFDPLYGSHLGGFMKTLGWVKHKQPRKANGTKYTGSEFCEELNVGFFGFDGDPEVIYPSRIVANIGGNHTVAIIETKEPKTASVRYKVHDTWNSTDGCIGNYWTKA